MTHNLNGVPPPPLTDLTSPSALPSALYNHDPLARRWLQPKSAHPSRLRPTLRTVPSSQDLLSATCLPLGVIVHPFDNSDVLHVPQGQIIERCRSCKAYLNPYCTFVTPRIYRCSLCARNNEISDSTASILAVDSTKLAAINYNSVDFVANSEFQCTPPSPPCFIFLFDVSVGAISSGYLKFCCTSLKENFSRLSFNPRTKISFIFFGSVVTVLSFSTQNSIPRLLILTDFAEVIKLPNILVNCSDFAPQILSAIELFPDWFATEKNPNCALGHALELSKLMLKSSGGRITVFLHQIPDLEPGSIPPRLSDRISRPTKEDLAPLSTFYKDLAVELWEIRVTVDLFVLGGQSTDLPTLGQLSNLTGGTIHYFPRFHYLKNPRQTALFVRDLRDYLSRPYAYDTLVRVRVSPGLRIKEVIGNIFLNGCDFFRVGFMSPAFTFAAVLDVAEDLSSCVHVQTVLLYYNAHSELHVRYETLRLSVGESVPEAVLGADEGATALLVCRLLVSRVLAVGVAQLKGFLSEFVLNLLNLCRNPKYFAAGLSLRSPMARNLLLLPFLLFCLHSHETMTCEEILIDERFAAFSRVVSQSGIITTREICPFLYDVTELHRRCHMVEEGKYFVDIGPPLLPSYSSLDRNRVYLLDMGSHCLLLPRELTGEDVLFDLFGVSCYSEVESGRFVPGRWGNWLSYSLAWVVGSWSGERGTAMEVFVMRDDEGLGGRLKFDRSRVAQSYMEFIGGL